MFAFYGVTKKFQTHFWTPSLCVLDGLSFKVKEGSLSGFLGANGSGKTTSIKILLNHLFADEGKVEFYRWKDVSHERIMKKIGYVTERPYYYSYLTGREFLQYMGALSGIDEKRLLSIIERYSERLSIQSALDRRVATYSKGMLQRLGIVASLLHDPELLIFDEPTSGIDPVGRKEIKDFLVELHHEGKTIFVSSHIVSDLEAICSDLVVINRGKLVYEGGCRELLENNSQEGYVAVVASDHERLAVLSQRVKKIGSDKVEYLFEAKNKEHFLRACLDCGTVPIKFEKQVPNLEEIIYGIS